MWNSIIRKFMKIHISLNFSVNKRLVLIESLLSVGISHRNRNSFLLQQGLWPEIWCMVQCPSDLGQQRHQFQSTDATWSAIALGSILFLLPPITNWTLWYFQWYTYVNGADISLPSPHITPSLLPIHILCILTLHVEK